MEQQPLIESTNDSKREETLNRVYSSIDTAKDLLKSLKFKKGGKCRLSVLKPTKRNGYIQVSGFGVNKLMTLGDLLCAVKGQQRQCGQLVSHLCGQPACMIPEHVVLESAQEEQRPQKLQSVSRLWKL
jgi:hypothetical protein